MDDIFEEIDGELRAARARRAIRRYGGLGIAAAVLAVAGLGAWQGWQWYEQRQDQAAAAIYLGAMHNADDAVAGGNTPAQEAAIAGFARVAATAPKGYRTLARLHEAALREDGGQKAAALATWQSVADDGAADPLLRELADLLWVEVQLDAADPAMLQARLDKLADATDPWHGLAQEAQALLAMRAGHNDVARRTLQALASDVTVPDGVRGRANALLARLGAE